MACIFPWCKPAILEMHDPEPEMAMHIKKLPYNNCIVRIERLLERFLCRVYPGVVVTSHSHKELIQQRTGVSADRILVYPNLPVAPVTLSQHSNAEKNFMVLYTGSLSYDYTIEGVQDLFAAAKQCEKAIPELELVIAGDGHGLPSLQKAAVEAGIAGCTRFPGNTIPMEELRSRAAVAVIPWRENEMTRLLLPTKLLEYMASGKAIIAPDFGEFRRYLSHGSNALLYASAEELRDALLRLYREPALRDTVGNAARNAFHEYFDCEKINLCYLQFVRCRSGSFRS